MTDPTHERLASGAARLVGDDPADAYEARIVPIPEDETTTGLSGTTTTWPRETLKEATERGVWNDVKLLKGPGGSGHFDLNEQPPVENLAGSIVGSHYEDGVGPVLDAELIDEQLARAVEHDLVSVSPDMSRDLGDPDEQLGTRPAERINEVAYITILDRAASANATIEPAHAEALGMHPDEYDRYTAEQLADVGDAVRWESDTGGEREPADVRYGVVVDALQDGDDDSVLVAVYQPNEDYDGWENRNEQNPIKEENLETVGSDGVGSLPAVSNVVGTEQNAVSAALADHADGDVEQLGQLYYLRFWPDPTPAQESSTAEAFEAAADAVDTIDGVTAVLRTDTDDEGAVRDGELLAIVDPDRAPLGSLNDDLRSALDETPFAVGGGFNWVPELHTEHLAAGDAGAAANDTGTDADTQHSNQPIGADADPSDPATDSTPDTMSDEDIDDLKEQLAAAEQRADDLEDKKESLESEVSEKAETIDDLEEEVESEREQRKEDTEHLRRRYAEAVTDSDLAAQALVDNDDKSVEDLAEMAIEAEEGEADDETDEGDEEEQLSAMERYEQLAAESPTPRGGGSGERQTGGSGAAGGDATEEQLAAAEDRAYELISANDAVAPEFEQLGPVEYVRQHKGVDPLEYDSRKALRKAHERNGGEA